VKLLDGETVDFAGRFFTTKAARLYSLPDERPPVYLSAFHEGAAELAGKLADGVWTLGDPQEAPSILKTYKKAARKEPFVLLQAVFSYASNDDKALESSREWKGTLVDRHYTDPIADPAEIHRNGENEVSDEMFTKQVIASSDPQEHVERIKALEKLGADAMVLMNVSAADPEGALRLYGDKVLPKLKSG
jgi:coenzyme F420-dependent glucose-6-phosphate dehydrogenase